MTLLPYCSQHISKFIIISESIARCRRSSLPKRSHFIAGDYEFSPWKECNSRGRTASEIAVCSEEFLLHYSFISSILLKILILDYSGEGEGRK